MFHLCGAMYSRVGKIRFLLSKKQLVGYGSMLCDDNDEWSFGGPEDEWYLWVTDIDWPGLGLAIDSP